MEECSQKGFTCYSISICFSSVGSVYRNGCHHDNTINDSDGTDDEDGDDEDGNEQMKIEGCMKVKRWIIKKY